MPKSTASTRPRKNCSTASWIVASGQWLAHRELSKGERPVPEHKPPPPFTLPRFSLRQNFLDHMPMHIGEPAIDAVMAKSQACVIDAQEVKDSGVQVVAIGDFVNGLV